MAAERGRLSARHPGLVLFACLFAGQTALLVLTPMLPAVADDLGVATAVAGQLRAVSGTTAGVLALVLGGLAARSGLRSVLSAGLGLLAAGSLCSAVAPSFAALAAAQLPIGAGLALVLGGAVAAAGQWAPGGERARLLSWTLLGPPAAWVVGMPLAGWLTERSWRLAWVAVPLVAALVALAAVRSRPADPPEPVPAHPWRAALARPGVVGWALGELCAYAGWTGALVFAGALFIETYGVSATTVGWLLCGAAIAYIPGNFVASRWVDRRARAVLLAAASGCAVLVVVFGGWRSGIAQSFSVFAVMAVLAGARTIAGSAFGLDAAPGEKIVVMSLRAAGLQFGYLLGAVLGGAALAWGGYWALGIVLGVCWVLAALPHLAAVGSDLVLPRRRPEAARPVP